MSEPTFEPGSFRDPRGRVFSQDGQIYRAVRADALADFRDLEQTPFFKSATASGRIIHTQVEDTPPLAGWAGVLRHDRIPFISYPYEWSFQMLQDAGLALLGLLEESLAEDITLLDGTAFNMQWQGTRPVFIDVPSFIPWTVGKPWAGYRQFCQSIFNPLLLQAYADVPFQPWLRGSLEGLSAADTWNLLPLQSRWRMSVLTHVYLQARLQANLADTKRRTGDDLRAAGLSKEVVAQVVRRLKGDTAALNWRAARSTWSEYTAQCNYSTDDYERKRAFVKTHVGRTRRHLVWDLGCNTGDFSRLAAESADYVVAADGDALVVDTLYRALRKQGHSTILPLIWNITDPSPDLGWALAERKAWIARGRPDYILCLALAHHLIIGGNVPLEQFISWLAGFHSALIVEFVPREDEMVQRLLRQKDIPHDDYTERVFRDNLERFFTISERLELTGKRVLFACVPR